MRVATTSPYDLVGRPLSTALPRGTGVARLSAAVAKSADVLAGHEVNECRSDLKENPATVAWAWGGGVVTPLPAFQERTQLDAAAIGVNPCFVGAARLQGVRTIPVAWFITDTTAFGTTLPELSVTAPVIPPKVDCPSACRHNPVIISKQMKYFE